jgi:hypothetical protein
VKILYCEDTVLRASQGEWEEKEEKHLDYDEMGQGESRLSALHLEEGKILIRVFFFF